MQPVIRLQTMHDHERLVAMGQRFISESLYGRLFPVLKTSTLPVEDLIALCCDQGAIFVAEVDDRVVGMIGLVLVKDHPMTFGTVVEEVAWWVEPEHRKGRVGPLLEGAARQWTTTNGGSVLKMVAPWGTDVGRYLEKRGYTAVETAYMIRL